MAKHAIAMLLFSILLFFLAHRSSCHSFDSISFRSAPKFLGRFSTSNPQHHRRNDRRSKQLLRYWYETQYFKQRLDYFSFSELPRFNQRYLISSKHWVGHDRIGPIFLYCRNEGDIEWFAANTGFVWEIAPSFGAMVVFPEHRYYGESMPFGSREEAYKNAATLITSLKRNLSAEACPVVLFGGSHGGRKELKNTKELANWLDSAYSYLAMVNYPYLSGFLMPLPGHPIREVCRKIDGCPEGTSILERVFEGVSVYYNHTGEVDCFELDDDPHGMDGWNWQACTEMVMPLSSSPDASMFPTYDFNFSAFQKECWTNFKVNPRSRWITTEFGGKDIMTNLKTFGSNIIFSNDFLDPWSGGSVTQNVSDSIVALNTQEGAHHMDLRAATAQDPNWLVEQRATEFRLIKKWLSDYYHAKGATLLPNVERGNRATSM